MSTEWTCKCHTLNGAPRKRCSNCMSWRRTSEINAIESRAADVGGYQSGIAKCGKNAWNTRADGMHLKNDKGSDQQMARDIAQCKHDHIVSAEEAIASGCSKCKMKNETSDKSSRSHDDDCRGRCKPKARKESSHDRKCIKDYHRMTLKEAAAHGCVKCKKEYTTGIKTARSHTKGCPRRRGAVGKSLGNNVALEDTVHMSSMKNRNNNCSKQYKNTTDQGSLSSPVSSHHSIELLEDGDPPWRTSGNSWIGRRLLYNLEAAKKETRSCYKNKFYFEDINHNRQQKLSPSAIKGTIMGFISEKDKDSNGNPGYISIRDGIPAILFHVVFDDRHEYPLLNKDFEEWEINEQCEWIYDEETDRDDDDDDDVDETPLDIEKEHSNNEISIESTTRCTNEKKVANLTTTNPSKGAKIRVTSDSKEPANNFVAIPTNDFHITDHNVRENAVPNASQESIKPNHYHCSAFNEALKSALRSHTSSSLYNTINNHPSPVPPLFLSHQEESTLRTALAFAIIKARNKQKPTTSTSKATHSGSTSLIKTACISRTQQTFFQENASIESLVQSNQQSLMLHPISSSSSRIIFERTMTHIRDILKVAVSSLLPLYKGALDLSNKATVEGGQLNSNSNTKSAYNTSNERGLPSCVYDFEAGHCAPFTAKENEKTQLESHNASFDGLCQYAAIKLSRLIHQTKMKHRLEQRTRKTKATLKHSQIVENSVDNVMNIEGRNHTESGQTGVSDGKDSSKHMMRNAIVHFFHTDIIGKIYESILAECSDMCSVASRIEQMMATCHVIHRLIYFDQNNSFTLECIIAISRTLAEFYINDFSCFIGSSDNGHLIQNERTRTSKDRVQVVTPNWTSSRPRYSKDRNKRRSRSIDTMFHDTGSLVCGAKRKNDELNEQEITNQYPLPNEVDVFVVNLLRLLECAAEIRAYHCKRSCSRQQIHSCDTATEIIKEIKSSSAIDLMMPIHLDEIANFYVRESHAANVGNMNSRLRPCSKLLLRVHLVNLIKKLSAYEPV